MRRKLISFLFVSLLLSFQFLIFSSPVFGYYTNMSATVVIGQPNFTSNFANQGGSANANTLSVPAGFYFDGSRLIVVDEGNHRVLIYNSIPTTNNASADVVVGQTNMTSASANRGGSVSANGFNDPRGVCSDGTRLVVVEQGNNRLLVFNSIPTSNNATADVVIGQSNFSLNSANQGGVDPQANTLKAPRGCFSDGTRLFISDTGNHRVLIYNSIPTTNNASADVVVGQPSFTIGSGSTGATKLNIPAAIWSDGQQLAIADSGNSRVLIYNSIPTQNGSSPDVVVGQSNFDSGSANQGNSVPGPNTLNLPRGLFISNGRLFVGENNNHRVLIFNSIPRTNNASADIVIGQANFTSNTANQGGSPAANTFSQPYSNGVWVVNNKLLLIGDGANNRVLIFNNVIATPGISLEKVERLSDGRYQIKGNVKVGEALHYDLGLGGGVSFSVNGVDGSGVTSVGNQMNDGAGSLFYDFTHTFEPWVNNGSKESWSEERGYTVKVSSRNSNTDSSSAFLFEPFKAVSFGGGVAKFSVGKYQIQRIKDNVSFFDLFVKKVPIPKSNLNTPWTKLLTNISTSLIDSDGVVSAPLTNTQTSLSKGTYLVKIQSVSKDSNVRQDSRTISANVTTPIVASSYINPFNYQTNSSFWFPLQLTKSPSFSSPTITGIAFAGSTVALRVTNLTTGKSQDYTTTTNSTSRFTLTPSIASSSILTISVYDTQGHYNYLLPITVTGEDG